jgi:ABC-type polysaccharide transport system, permease component
MNIYRETHRYKKVYPLLLMTIPFLIITFIFYYLPLWGWIIAFIDYMPGVSVFQSKFVGLLHFGRLFSNNKELLMVLRNTIVISLLNIIMTPVPILLAIMITEVKNNFSKRLIQTISAFPYFVSWIIVYSLFFSLLSVDDGLINHIFISLHIINQPIDLLGSSNSTWLLQTFATTWKSAGYTAIIYMAAITGIDQELYNSAEVDGAGKLKQIIHITIPCIMPTYVIMLVITIGNFLSNGFEQYYIFHNALNHDMIEVLDTYTYRLGIEKLDFSFATAVGMLKTLVSIILLFVSNRIAKKAVGASII